ncbi:MAG: hypothetical protein KDD66_13965, partial [Bdellovibrionales bacterium]|nr:hypothetical protein [Bdellovibrionales bacterium]
GTLLWLHSLLVYAACIPGILAAVLTAYSLFFLRANLLEANLLVYFLPIASMIATLCFLAKSMSFDAIPGFDRLSGLMTVIAVTFILVLALERTRIWLFFGGSIAKLAALVAGLFLLLRWGTNALFRGRGEPKKPRPKISI